MTSKKGRFRSRIVRHSGRKPDETIDTNTRELETVLKTAASLIMILVMAAPVSALACRGDRNHNKTFHGHAECPKCTCVHLRDDAPAQTVMRVGADSLQAPSDRRVSAAADDSGDVFRLLRTPQPVSKPVLLHAAALFR